MRIKKDDNGEVDQVSLETVNRKLESFVEILLSKLTTHQQEISNLKSKIKKLEKASK